MNLKKILLLLCAIVAISSTNSIKVVDSFSELAAHHCESFPIELLYRLSTGQLAEVNGKKYKDLDCYIRQFVNKGIDNIIQTVKIHTRSKRPKKMENRWFKKNSHKLIHQWNNMQKVWLNAYLKIQTLSKQSILFGDLSDLSFKMITLQNG